MGAPAPLGAAPGGSRPAPHGGRRGLAPGAGRVPGSRLGPALLELNLESGVWNLALSPHPQAWPCIHLCSELPCLPSPLPRCLCVNYFFNKQHTYNKFSQLTRCYLHSPLQSVICSPLSCPPETTGVQLSPSPSSEIALVKVTSDLSDPTQRQRPFLGPHLTCPLLSCFLRPDTFPAPSRRFPGSMACYLHPFSLPRSVLGALSVLSPF